jgi:hypothetical protein
MTLITEIFETSKAIKDDRTTADAFLHCVTEIGELGQEIQISQGKSYKQRGKDGVVGESIDAIVCLVDIILLEDPSITEEDLISIVKLKLEKWKKTG